jgi:HK97 family phage portal protein
MSFRSWLGKTIGLTDGSFWAAFFGQETSSGKTVNAETAMNVSACWACVRLLSETVGTIPLMLYERLADGDRREASDHWLYELLHDSPNADQTPAEFWEGRTMGLCLAGNGLARKEMGANGRVLALEHIPAQGVMPRRESNGRLRYRYTYLGREFDLDEDQVFHIRGFGGDPMWGMSPISYARHSLGIALAADEAAGKLFANGLQPSGLIKTEKFLTDKQRADWNKSLEKFQGSSNSGKWMTLEGGFDFKQLSINPDDMQMLESRAFSVEDVCRWFRVPPFMVGHTEKSTSWGTGIEQQTIGFLTYALAPYLVRTQQRINKSLLSPVERKRYYAEFNIEALLRADSAGRAAFLSVMAQNGFITRNEGRRRENLKRMEGGDVLTVQSNLVPLDKLGTEPVQTLDNALRALVDTMITARLGHNGGPPLDGK